MFTGGTGSATASDEPWEDDPYHCFNWPGGVGLGTRLNDGVFRHHVWRNCPSPDEENQPAWEVQVVYVNNPDDSADHGFELVVYCVAPSEVIDIGRRPLTVDHMDDHGVIERIQFHGPADSGGCAGWDPPDPPSATMSFHVAVRHASQDDPTVPMPLAGAKYVVEYLGYEDGDSSQDIVWQPVTTGPAGTGDPVTGFLDDEGRATFDFVPPVTSYHRPDGHIWHGCEFRPPVAVYGRWSACADDDIRLRVLGDTADHAIQVVTPDGTVAVVDDISIGHFFEREPGHTYLTDTPEAHAQRALRNVIDVAATLPSDHQPDRLTVMVEPDDVGDSYYDPVARVIHVSQFDTGRSDVEIHAATGMFLDLIGIDPTGIPETCSPAAFVTETSEWCAISSGFATFVAAMAEHTNVDTQVVIGQTGFDVESCYTGTPPTTTPCGEGPTVVGNVAATFHDITDGTGEVTESFTDSVQYPLSALTGTLRQAGATTFDEFLAAWPHKGDDDLLAMFQNRLVRIDLQDDDEAEPLTGQWTTDTCDACRSGDMSFAVAHDGEAAIEWDLDRYLPGDGSFDVWVRHPAGQTGYVSDAQFVTFDESGTKEITVDQSTAMDGWARLGQVTRSGSSGPVRLAIRSQSPSDRALVADAVIVAPAMSESQPGVPWVHITGTVQTANATNPDDPIGTFANAEYRLVYRDEATSQWLPVRDGVGGAGDRVQGHLDQGRFVLDFVYPQKYRTPGGEVWTGCAPTVPVVPFMRSHACAHEDLALQIYGAGEDGRVHVRNARGGSELLGVVHLGRSFEPDRSPVHSIDTPAGHIFRDATDMVELVDSLPETLQRLTDIVAVIDDSKTYSFFDPATGVIHIRTDQARDSTTKHEVAHKYDFDLTGTTPVEAECNTHNFTDTSAGEKCAMTEGFAEFLALVGENGPGRFDRTTTVNGPVKYDLETCFEVERTGYITYCKDGPTVEGRVAAALWDYYDPRTGPSFGSLIDLPVELIGFYDWSHYTLADIISIFAEFDTNTWNEFREAWHLRHPDEATTMRDDATSFGNTVGYTHLADAAVTIGTWRDRECPNGCVEDSYQVSDKAAPAAAAWRVTGSTAPRHVWIHLPPDAAMSDRDTEAVYRIPTFSGIEEIVVDQSVTSGWVRITDVPLALRTDAITVSNSRKGGSLAADGLITARAFTSGDN